MANPFKTGRSRTIVFDGNISGSVGAQTGCHSATRLGGYVVNQHASNVYIEFPGICHMSDSDSAIIPASLNCASPPTTAQNRRTIELWMDIPSFTGTDVTYATTYVDDVWSSPGGSYNRDISGSYSITMTVEEWCYVYDLSDNDADNYPLVDGASYKDGMFGKGAEFYEALKVGTTVSVSFTEAGVTASCHVLVTAGNTGSPGYLIERKAITESKQMGNSTLITANMNGVNMDAGIVFDHSSTWGRIRADIGTYSETYSDPSAPHTAICDTLVNPPIKFQLEGRLRRFGTAYPSPGLTAQWQYKLDGATNIVDVLLNPTGTAQVTQLNWAASGTVDGSTIGTGGVNEWLAQRVWLKASSTGGEPSLSSQHEDSRDQRCQMRGKPWNCFTLAQVASKVVAASHNYASPGGSITLLETVWEGFRYAQFTADQPGTLTVGTKSFDWTVATPGTSQTITIDLCSPTTVGYTLPDVDDRQSRFPLHATGSSPTSSYPDETTMADPEKGAYWGVLDARTASISGVPATTTLHMGSLNIIRQVDAKATFLTPFNYWQTGWQSASDNTYLQQAIQLESDGKRVADWPGSAHVVPFSGAAYYQMQSLGDLINCINYLPGWSATAITPPTDGYHTTALPGFNAFGNGAIYQGGNWTDGVDKDATSLTVAAQDLWDEVQGYPQCGDPWEQTSYGGYTPIRFTKFLRVAGDGEVFKSGGAVNTGAVVALLERPSMANRGNGTADGVGFYRTGIEYGFGHTLHRSQITTAIYADWSTSDAANRRRLRASFRHDQTTGLPWVREWKDGSLALGYVANGDAQFKFCRHSWNALGWDWEVVATTVGDVLSFRFDRDEFTGRILGALVRNISGTPTGYTISSDDFGQTWSAPV